MQEINKSVNFAGYIWSVLKAWGMKLIKRNGAAEGQGCRRAQARGHPASHVD
jgi:hypothetical protein